MALINETRAEDPNIYIIDLCEQRPLNKSVSLIFFNAKEQKVVKKATFDTSKTFVQVVNCSTHIIFVQRKIDKKMQTIQFYAYLRGGTRLV